MFPYYFPYDSSYYMPQYSSFYSEANVYPFYGMSADLPQQEPIYKKQQVNTNYTINDCQNKVEPIQQPTPVPQQPLDFIPDNQEFQNKLQQPSNSLLKPNPQRTHQIKQKQQQPKFKYTHKNFESNIINKIFSFLWSEDKSKGFVTKILSDKTKVSLYFDYIKIIRKYCKRYINKEYLLNLCDYQIEHIAYKIVMKQTEKLKYFSMEEFSLTVRRLIFIYLDTVCLTSILTSKKMRTDIWREHFEKMRNIKAFLFGKLNSEEYDQRMCFSYKQIYANTSV